ISFREPLNIGMAGGTLGFLEDGRSKRRVPGGGNGAFEAKRVPQGLRSRRDALVSGCARGFFVGFMRVFRWRKKFFTMWRGVRRRAAPWPFGFLRRLDR